jgi:uncharacterized protein YbjT (DUF2867 family)
MRGRPILLTGATGYIGSRLLRELEAGGCTVRCLARQPARVAAGRATTEVVTGDCLDAASLDAAMKGVDQAFYLVHSMSSGARFAALDREAAANFGRSARRAGVRRIIYLGGLGDDDGALSSHLKSRVETGEALRDSGVPVIEFRASIVIGGGRTGSTLTVSCPRRSRVPLRNDAEGGQRPGAESAASRGGKSRIGTVVDPDDATTRTASRLVRWRSGAVCLLHMRQRVGPGDDLVTQCPSWGGWAETY